MTTLADVRQMMRLELGTMAGAADWSDAELDRHAIRALEELSAEWPREETTQAETVAGSREIDLSAIGGLVEVEAVEYPPDRFPPVYVPFSRWAGLLSLHLDRAPAGGNARIYYTARHLLDGDGTTLEPFQVELLERASALADALTTGDAVPERFAAYARARLTAFRQLLHQYGRRNRVRSRRLYVPA
jgi:hypothetical protein